MTVAALIEKLQAMPPYAEVVYQFHSDWWALEADEIELVKADDRKMIFKDGSYRRVDPRWVAEGQQLDYVTVVTFPGN